MLIVIIITILKSSDERREENAHYIDAVRKNKNQEKPHAIHFLFRHSTSEILSRVFITKHDSVHSFIEVPSRFNEIGQVPLYK